MGGRMLRSGLVGLLAAGALAAIPTASLTAAPAPATTAPAVTAAAGGLTFSHAVPLDPQRAGNEPDIMVNPNGHLFSSSPFGFSTTQSFLWASKDQGRTFQLTPGNIGATKPATCVGGGDTELANDPHGNIFFSDLQGLSSFSNSVSKDEGATWSTNCAAAPNTPVDRQWYAASGDLTANTLQLFEDYDAVGGASGTGTQGGNALVESFSTDGLTFGPLVSNPLPKDCSSTTTASPNLNCVSGDEGISGNQVRDPATGDLLISHTNAMSNQVFVERGKVTVTGPTATAAWTKSASLSSYLCAHPGCVYPSGAADLVAGSDFSVIAEDSAHHFYDTFSAAPLSDKDSSGNQHQIGPDTVYLVTSPDGTSWSQPVPISQGGDNLFSWVTAGDDGRIDVAWYHSDERARMATTAKPCASGATTGPCYGSSDLTDATWNVQMAQSLNASSGNPTVSVSTVTEHPIKTGEICTMGLGCTTGGDRSLGDFFQVKHDAQGAALLIFVDDTSNNFSGGEGIGPAVMVRQTGGPGLSASATIDPAQGPGSASGSITDPTGDAFYNANGASSPAGDNLDLTGASVTQTSAATLTVKINVKSLANLTVSPTVGGPNAAWIARWELVQPGQPGNGHIYYAGLALDNGTPRYFDGDTQCIATTHCKYLTYPGDHAIATGTLDPLTGTITIPVPLADVTPAGVNPATTQIPLYSAMAFSATSVAPFSSGPLFNVTDATEPFTAVLGASNPLPGTTTTPPVYQHPVGRQAGADRIATAVAVSQTSFPAAGSAASAVLATGFDFPDALSGTPLAAKVKGPLLLTHPTGLDANVATELSRAVPKGATVYLLGGTNALSDAVAASVTSLGYTVARYAGATRYSTAVAIATQGLGNPATVLEATGQNFPDALAGGAAAAHGGFAILLTNGSTQAQETAAYLAAHSADKRYALGGPAAAADPSATPEVGQNRYQTAVFVASAFFSAPKTVGAATAFAFPDALSGGAAIAKAGGPVLLVPSSGLLPGPVTDYLQINAPSITSATIYGGALAVGADVAGEIQQQIG